MYKEKLIPVQKFWRYVDELDGKGLILSYPQKIIKKIKEIFYDSGCNFIITSKSEIPISNDKNEAVSIKLTPNLVSALNSFFEDRLNQGVKNCPSSKELYNVFIENDKYFAMMLDLEEVLSKINNCIQKGEYKYASIILAQLSEKYNMEIIDMVNEYFKNHPKLDLGKKDSYRHYFSILLNRSFILSNKVYIALIIYKNELYKSGNSDEYSELVYENYNVLSTPSDHRVKPKGTFLEDCKAIASLKKQLGFGEISLLEFHDLMEFGYYNDKILSIENMGKVSEIFSYAKWIHHFFLALSLYCDKMIKIEDIQERVKEKSIVDTRKINDLDLFARVVKYYDSIYDTLIEK